MKFEVNDEKFIKFLQEGGVSPEAASEEAVPPVQEEAQGSPEELLVMACQQALETQDCNLALQVCQAVMQMIGGGAGAPEPVAPEGQAPVYKKGGKLSRWISK